MERKYLSIFIAVFIFSLLFYTACDNFNMALSDYIENSTGRASGIDDDVKDTPRHVMANGVTAIPPNEKTIITVELRNPQSYDLELTLVDQNGNEIDHEKATAEQSADKQTAIVTIKNPERSETDYIDLTLNISANGRPMEPYKLPVMQARYFDTDIDVTVIPKSGPLVPPPENIPIPQSVKRTTPPPQLYMRLV